jgi:hypothetical protein
MRTLLRGTSRRRAGTVSGAPARAPQRTGPRELPWRPSTVAVSWDVAPTYVVIDITEMTNPEGFKAVTAAPKRRLRLRARLLVQGINPALAAEQNETGFDAGQDSPRVQADHQSAVISVAIRSAGSGCRLEPVGNSAGKMSIEARDRGGIFGDAGRFLATETVLSRVSRQQSRGMLKTIPTAPGNRSCAGLRGGAGRTRTCNQAIMRRYSEHERLHGTRRVSP